MLSRRDVDRLREQRVHGTDSFPCGLYRSIGDTKSLMVKYHWHKECEIIYFMKGDFDIEINMEKYQITKECICFINSGELHNIICTKAPYEEHAIVFLPELFGFRKTGLSDLHIVDPFVENKIKFPRILTAEQKAFHFIREELLQAESTLKNQEIQLENMKEKDALMETAKDSVNQLLMKASVLKILAYLEAEHLLSVNEDKIDSRIDIIKNVILYIEENYQEKIYLQDLAGIANMNEQYFCRFFKNIIGKTCVEYMNEYRIKQARKLLERTSLSVTEVSMECGFNNIGNFLREFKKTTGSTPLKYKNLVK